MAFWLFPLLVCFESFLAALWLLLIPGDPKNALWLGLSLPRLLMAGALVAAGLVFAGLVFVFRRQTPEWVQRIFLSPRGLWITLVGPILSGLAIPLLDRWDGALFDRLFPGLAWLIVVFLTALGCQLTWTHGTLWEQTFQPVRRWEQTRSAEFSGLLLRLLDWLRVHPHADLFLLMVPSLPLLFWNAIRFDLPMGYAGLYALMTGQIAEGGFTWPLSTPYYGPGGIPFAYPPLGFYLGALFVRLGLPLFTYLRFAGPLFTWLCLPVVYLISRRLSGMRLASVAAALIFASIDAIYTGHAYAAGMVRALGFLFSLLAFLFYLRACDGKGWKDAALSALFFALSIWTHLSYAEFFALTVIFLVLARPLKLHRLGLAAGVAVGGLLLSAPYWLTVISRYGIPALAGAFGSHDNGYFLLILQEPARLLPWLKDTLRNVLIEPAFWGAAVTAIALSLSTGRYFLPLWFLGMALFTSGDRFTILSGAILAGWLIAWLRAWLSAGMQGFGSKARAAVFTMLIVGAIYFPGLFSILSHRPAIQAETFDLTAYIQQNTPQTSVFLVVADPDEAEWFPFLLRRTPLAASWGAEWIGAYDQQVGYLQDINSCEVRESLDCLTLFMDNLGAWPNLLIIHTDRLLLTRQLENSERWQKIYSNSHYLVWQKR